MASYTNKYVSDIPLKRPQETFVDDPASLDEVSLEDLLFDLSNDIKQINSLHGYHALAIFKTVLEDLIFLSSRNHALLQFRKQQLALYSLDLDALWQESELSNWDSNNVENGDENGDNSSVASVLPPASGSQELPNINSSIDLGESVMSSRNNGISKNDFNKDTMTCHEDLSVQSFATLDEEDRGAFISTESLVLTTSLDVPQNVITCHNIDRSKKEVLFHMSPKIKQQAEHLLKCFSLAKAPPITIEQFLVRIKTYSPSISVSVYVHSAYMLYKLCVLLQVVELTPLNVYRFILASLRCSTKKLEDVYQKQKSFATVGGVALKELSKIEVSFVYLLNFRLVVSESILNQFLATEFSALHVFCERLRETEEKEGA